MTSPLRQKPDYLENPHDASSPEEWLKRGAVNADPSVKPEEDAFFEDLVDSTLHKGFTSSFMFQEPTPMDGKPNSSPAPMVHNVHVDPHQDSQFQRLDQDHVNPLPDGLGKFVMSKNHSATDDLDSLANSLKNVNQQATQAVKSTTQVNQQAQKIVPQPTPGSAPLPPNASSAPAPNNTSTAPQPAPATTIAPAATTAPTAPTPTTAPAVPSMSPSSDAIKPQTGTPPQQKQTIHTYTTASLSERAHYAWFQSNPYMQFNNPSPMNPAGQYNDMNYNPRPTYFEEGTGDSSFANLHNAPNGNYTRDSLNFGGVTDLLITPPADPRWTDDDANLGASMPMTGLAVSDPREESAPPPPAPPSNKTSAVSMLIDREMMRTAKSLSTEDNPYIRDYSNTTPLNNSLTDSVNAPELDPNKPQSDHDEYGSLHQTQPRLRAIGPQGPLAQFDPTNQTADPYIETVCPPSADGTRFSLPSFKTKRPVPGLSSTDFVRDH